MGITIPVRMSVGKTISEKFYCLPCQKLHSSCTVVEIHMKYIRIMHSFLLFLILVFLAPTFGYANEVGYSNFKKCRTDDINFILFEKKGRSVQKSNFIEGYKLSKNSFFYLSEFELESIPFKPRSIPMIPERYKIAPVFYVPDEGSYWIRLFVASANINDDVIGYKIRSNKLKSGSLELYFSKLEDLGQCSKLEIGFGLNNDVK